MAWTMKFDAEDRLKKETKKRSIEIAKGMLNKKINIDTIIELTGLTKDGIKNI